MHLVENTKARKFHFPGLVQQTLAGPEHGMKTLEVWQVTLAPGAEMPPYHHNSDVAWITLRGTGEAIIAEERVALKPDTTLNIPPYVIRQVTNTGVDDLVILVIRGLVPVPRPATLEQP